MKNQVCDIIKKGRVLKWYTGWSQKPVPLSGMRVRLSPRPLTPMSKFTLNQAIKETREVASQMPIKYPIHARLVDLIEEVGELANAIQVQEGYKSKKRKKSDLVNSVCDVLYSIFLVASHYNVDLDKEYPLVLQEIDERRKSGAFDHE